MFEKIPITDCLVWPPLKSNFICAMQFDQNFLMENEIFSKSMDAIAPIDTSIKDCTILCKFEITFQLLPTISKIAFVNFALKGSY